MVPAAENGLSAAAVYQAARQLPREGRMVLIELLASSLRLGGRTHAGVVEFYETLGGVALLFCIPKQR